MGRYHKYKLWVIHKDRGQLVNIRKFITKRIKACEEMSSFKELLKENGVDVPKGGWPRKTWMEARKFDYEGYFKIGRIEAYEYQKLSFQEIFEAKKLPCLPISEDDFTEIPTGFRFKIEHERTEGYGRIPFVGEEDYEEASVLSYLLDEFSGLSIRGWCGVEYGDEFAGTVIDNSRELIYSNTQSRDEFAQVFAQKDAIDSYLSEGLIPLWCYSHIDIDYAHIIKAKLKRFYDPEEIPFDSSGKYILTDRCADSIENLNCEDLFLDMEEITVQQATAISKFKGSCIHLYALKSIPPKAVDILSGFVGTIFLNLQLYVQLFLKFDLEKKLKCVKKGLIEDLEEGIPGFEDEFLDEINNLTYLSPALARFLVTRFQDYLPLNKLEALSASIAQILSSIEGEISLNGLSEISDSTCRKLSNFKGTELSLENLKKISLSQAKSLSKCFHGWSGDPSEPFLYLGILELSEEVAGSLSCINGGLVLSKLSKLTPQAALKLSTLKGDLSIGELKGGTRSGITSMSAAAAKSLSKFKGERLYLLSLRSLSAAAAKSLSKFKGELHLDGLKSLSDAAAKSLSKIDEDKLWLSDEIKAQVAKYR